MKTRTRGLFHCPQCDISRAYLYRRIRRYFVLLAVPVVPLSGEEEFVQCGFCRSAFRPSIIEAGQTDDAARVEVEDQPSRELLTELHGTAASTLLVWDEDVE